MLGQVCVSISKVLHRTRDLRSPIHASQGSRTALPGRVLCRGSWAKTLMAAAEKRLLHPTSSQGAPSGTLWCWQPLSALLIPAGRSRDGINLPALRSQGLADVPGTSPGRLRVWNGDSPGRACGAGGWLVARVCVPSCGAGAGCVGGLLWKSESWPRFPLGGNRVCLICCARSHLRSRRAGDGL